MATNLSEIAFDEAASEIQLDTINAIRGGYTSKTVTALEIREYGVMVEYPNDDDSLTFRTFVPHANIKSISQVA
jgi:hypothetical protein